MSAFSDLGSLEEERGSVPPAIAVQGVTKRFGHVEALRGVDCTVGAGEIVALLGDNGAGKSTLLNIICGALAPDSGEVRVFGEALMPSSVQRGKQLGLEMAYQDLALAPDLSVLENVFLGNEVLRQDWLGKFGWLDRKRMSGRADADIRGLGVSLPSMDMPVSELSGGQRQVVAIARSAMWAKRAILLDEPTAALGVKQAGLVSEVIKAASNRRLGVLVVSHDVTRMLSLAHRVIVMRQGRIALDSIASALSLEKVVQVMVGGA
jgi:simple sugar transport system ATP-binding protein